MGGAGVLDQCDERLTVSRRADAQGPSPRGAAPASDTATILRCAAIAELVARRAGMTGGPAYTVALELRQLARDLGA